MIKARTFATALVTLALTLLPSLASGQGRPEDYARAEALSQRLQGLVHDAVETTSWIGDSHRFWYRKVVRGGTEFVLVDAATQRRSAPFDHARLAAALSSARDTTYTALTLPFNTFTFVEDESAIEVTVRDTVWRCTVSSYECSRLRAVPRPIPGAPRTGDTRPRVSPDGRLEAFIQNHNLAVRTVGSREVKMLSRDGSEGNAYALSSIAWSPDSRRIAAYRVKPGHQRFVHFIESSPEDQVQPKYSNRLYLKPGDVLEVEQPVLFHVETGEQIEIDNNLFPNAYAQTDPVWRKDGRAFTFEYNQRGHQVYRVIEVDGQTGAARAVVSEEPQTFFNYRPANGNQRDSGRKFRHDLEDGRAVIWMSERDGWSHLYMLDGATGRVKQQITKGEWVVRNVEWVDEEKRQIWFRASGMSAGSDPYFVHYYRIDFDGRNLVPFTDGDGDHTVVFSADRTYYVDVWSRVDQPPLAQLRRTRDRSIVMELERANDSELLKTGWRYPEAFVAKGRDGRADIWGVIIRPTNFDPSRSYPVIENIYAGPQGSFVPKTFSTQTGMQSLAELGFIVVQIDGMGTSNRSKAFHDVAWQNLGDAGFPDRILWHRAVAAKYSYYDTTRVGIYGTSAGGQNSMGALLFHPDFYKVAVSAAGCHDNRMDKIWWNEQWMGWPIGPHYEASSNVVNAGRLRGKLLLVVGELDTNVDPASTLQVVNALIRAGKTFDLLFIPGAGHTSGGEYGNRKRNDFFVQHLLGVQPPDRNAVVVSSVNG